MNINFHNKTSKHVMLYYKNKKYSVVIPGNRIINKNKVKKKNTFTDIRLSEI